jgi:hypothetical protein
VPFLFTGTLKVRRTIHAVGVSLSDNLRASLEYGHLLVHDLDRPWMPYAIHQLDRMEREHDQQGSGLL